MFPSSSLPPSVSKRVHCSDFYILGASPKSHGCVPQSHIFAVAWALLDVANFYEKALFVKVDLATALWWKQLLSVCPSRYASIRTLGSPLFWGSVHRMRSVFSSQRRCNLRRGLSSY